MALPLTASLLAWETVRTLLDQPLGSGGYPFVVREQLRKLRDHLVIKGNPQLAVVPFSAVDVTSAFIATDVATKVYAFVARKSATDVDAFLVLHDGVDTNTWGILSFTDSKRIGVLCYPSGLVIPNDSGVGVLLLSYTTAGISTPSNEVDAPSGFLIVGAV